MNWMGNISVHIIRPGAGKKIQGVCETRFCRLKSEISDWKLNFDSFLQVLQESFEKKTEIGRLEHPTTVAGPGDI